MLLHYIVRKDIETVAQSVENEFSGKPCSHLNNREKKLSDKFHYFEIAMKKMTSKIDDSTDRVFGNFS